MAFAEVRIAGGRLRLGPDADFPLEVDAGTGDAVLEVGGRGHRLRPATFGERRRLLFAAAGTGGRIDLDRLTAMAADLLVDPRPPPEDRELFGLAALAWSATGGAPEPPPPPAVPAAEVTVALARATGWSWRDVHDAPAHEVDRWYAALGPAPRAPAEDDGFHRFVLVED